MATTTSNHDDRRQARCAAVMAIVAGADPAAELEKGRAAYGPGFSKSADMLRRIAETLKQAPNYKPDDLARACRWSSVRAMRATLWRYGVSLRAAKPIKCVDQYLRTRGIHVGSPNELAEGVPRDQAKWMIAQIPAGATLVGFLRMLLIDMYFDAHE